MKLNKVILATITAGLVIGMGSALADNWKVYVNGKLDTSGKYCIGTSTFDFNMAGEQGSVGYVQFSKNTNNTGLAPGVYPGSKTEITKAPYNQIDLIAGVASSDPSGGCYHVKTQKITVPVSLPLANPVFKLNIHADASGNVISLQGSQISPQS